MAGGVSGDPDTNMVWEKVLNEQPLSFAGCYAVRVHGDSMSPIAWEGQFAIYDPEQRVKDGDLAIIRMNSGETLFKRVYEDTDLDVLICESIKEGHRPRNVQRAAVDWVNTVVGLHF